MPTQDTIAIPKGQWTKLNTGGAATGACSIYPLGSPIWVKGTAADVAPTDFTGGFVVQSAPGAIINQTLGALWPGLAAQYVWAYSASGATAAAVSCA